MMDSNVSEQPTISGPIAFDREAYGRYKIPMKIGEAISGWDDPQMVPARNAYHMRADDYVIGMEFRGAARAYPLWVIDNYHVVNDRVDGERFFVASCERCQSGAAFRAEVMGSPEREPLFRSVGFLNATLLLKDLRSGSHWLHYAGVGLDRRSAGTRLPWIPTYHIEWSDWIGLHPETVVMVPPEDPTHPDARHGHGREELFARPGMDPAFVPTIVGPLDETYPENEMVLGLDLGDERLAFPLQEVQRERGVVHGREDADGLVVFAGPRAGGFTMSAFVPEAAGRSLTFTRDEQDGMFVDHQTGSRWTVEGKAVAGALHGAALSPVRWSYVRWHAWIYSHRDTKLFRSRRPLPVFGRDVRVPEGLTPVLEALAGAGHEVRVAGPPVSQRRPREAEASLIVHVDGERLTLHVFGSETAAQDFDAFRGAWSGYPLTARSHESQTRRIGRVVIEADPEQRYADPMNIVPLPASVIPWARALSSPGLDDAALHHETRNGPPSRDGQAGFRDVVRALRLAGFEVIDVAFLPPGQLPVGAVNAVALTIDADRFLLYRFRDPALAEAHAARDGHAVAVGRFVMRSTPETMYAYEPAEVLYVGDDKIRWSALLDDPAFLKALREVIGRRTVATTAAS